MPLDASTSPMSARPLYEWMMPRHVAMTSQQYKKTTARFFSPTPAHSSSLPSHVSLPLDLPFKRVGW